MVLPTPLYPIDLVSFVCLFGKWSFRLLLPAGLGAGSSARAYGSSKACLGYLDSMLLQFLVAVFAGCPSTHKPEAEAQRKLIIESPA